ncbi:Pol polyprotein [Plakobranchus ocellatus]|uniref:Pol polyprotein n=1 Tax=Plakobranchus ocellatus TaxID=259542 RepID=A0AAV4BCB3_9GAST|nr:Pol polyprotein [Plakobranchus ocellatus]
MVHVTIVEKKGIIFVFADVDRQTCRAKPMLFPHSNTIVASQMLNSIEMVGYILSQLLYLGVSAACSVTRAVTQLVCDDRLFQCLALQADAFKLTPFAVRTEPLTQLSLIFRPLTFLAVLRRVYQLIHTPLNSVPLTDVGSRQKVDPTLKDWFNRVRPRVRSDRPAPLQPVTLVETPFQRVIIDIVGPLPVSQNRYEYILTLVDLSTRWAEGVPIRHISAKDVAQSLFDLFCRLGFPCEIQSDRGQQFMSQVLREFNSLTYIKHFLSSPYHPQTNGVVERFHSTLKGMLRKLAFDSPSNWCQYLNAALFAYRCQLVTLHFFCSMAARLEVQWRYSTTSCPILICRLKLLFSTSLLLTSIRN